MLLRDAVQALEHLVHALAHEALDRLALGGDLPEIAVLELARAALERGQPRVAVHVARGSDRPLAPLAAPTPRTARGRRPRADRRDARRGWRRGARPIDRAPTYHSDRALGRAGSRSGPQQRPAASTANSRPQEPSVGKPSVLRMSADPTIDPDVLERAISGLAGGDESVLAQAAAEGLPEPADVAEWVDRCKRLVLVERERSSLRSEVPALAQRLLFLLERGLPLRQLRATGDRRGVPAAPAGDPRAARRGRRRRVPRRSGRARLRRDRRGVSRDPRDRDPPDRARALQARTR